MNLFTLLLLSTCAFAEPWTWTPQVQAKSPTRRRPGLSGLVRRATVFADGSGVQQAEKPRRLAVVSESSIARPELDARAYRVVSLANGLVALLVSDPEADEAGAALSVRAGSFDDSRPGLAHLHEHMLFLGTKKYSGDDDYEDFLSSHGGGSNAYTGDEETCFYLSVNADELDGALDRFAQFFVEPLLSADCVTREVKAVDSEHAMSLNDDNWRLMSVLKTTVAKGHPFSKFATGTEATLIPPGESGETLMRELRRWHEQFYVAEAMRLVVVGKESLDELEDVILANGRFGAIPSKAAPADAADAADGAPVAADAAVAAVRLAAVRLAALKSISGRPEPWAKSSRAKMVDAVAVRSIKSLQLIFPIFPKRVLHDKFGVGVTPEIVASHLLGHEASATLHSRLRAAGYIESLSCGIAAQFEDAQLFEISLELTDLGASKRLDILRLCWRWIGVVKRSDASALEQAANELKQLQATRFRFQERNSGTADFAADLADNLWDFPTQPLAGPALVGAHDAGALTAVFDELTPANVLVMNVSPDAAELGDFGDGEWSFEKWHGAQYRSRGISSKMKNVFQKELDGEYLESDSSISPLDAENAASPRLFPMALPRRNEFVTNDFDILTKTAAGDLGVFRVSPQLWRRTDYGDAPLSVSARPSPKVIVRALLRGDAAPLTAEAFALTEVFCSYVTSELNYEAYDASLAGCHFTISSSRNGLLFKVTSFAAHADALLKLALEKVVELATETVTDAPALAQQRSKFDIERAEMQDRYEDSARDEPASLASTAVRFTMTTNSISTDAVAGALKTATLSKAQAEVRRRLSVATLEMYVAGNVDDQKAVDLFNAVANSANIAVDATLSNAPEPARKDVLAVKGDVLAVKLPKGDAGTAVELRAIRRSESPRLRFVGDALEAGAGADEEEDGDEDPNSAAELHWQIGRAGDDADAARHGWAKASVRDAACSLLGRLAQQSAFHQLRTVEQLGYVADAGADAQAGVIGLRCAVQSASNSPLALEERIEAWLALFRSQVEAMPETELFEKRAGLADLLTQRSSSLGDVVARDWSEISSKRLSFSHAAKRAVAVRTLTKQHLLQLLDTHVVIGAPERRLLRARVFAPGLADAAGGTGALRSFSAVEAFKSTLEKWQPPVRYGEPGAPVVPPSEGPRRPRGEALADEE